MLLRRDLLGKHQMLSALTRFDVRVRDDCCAFDMMMVMTILNPEQVARLVVASTPFLPCFITVCLGPKPSAAPHLPLSPRSLASNRNSLGGGSF